MINKQKIIFYIIIILALLGALYFVFNGGRKFSIDDYPNEIIGGLEQQRLEKPKDTELLLKLALEYNKLDKKDKTEELYKELIKLKPSESTYYFNLGMQYYFSERFEESAKYLLDGQKINPKLYQFYLPLLDMYEDAKTRNLIDIDYLITTFIRLDKEMGSGKAIVDDYVANISSLARAYKLKGQNKEAITTYKKMLELKIGDKSFLDSEISTLQKILDEQK